MNQRPDHLRNNNNRNRNNNNNNRNRNNGSRGGGGGGGTGGGRNNGMIDARARGNAQQLLEKYKNMGRDAAQAGDRVLAEYYMQFADHYFRVVTEFRARFEEQRTPEQRANGSYDDNDSNGQDDEIEGVGSENLAQTSGFGAAVTVQTFGADAAPGQNLGGQNLGGQNLGGQNLGGQNNSGENTSAEPAPQSNASGSNASGSSDAGSVDGATDEPDGQPRSRNRRSRSRNRRPEADAGGAAPLPAAPADVDG